MYYLLMDDQLVQIVLNYAVNLIKENPQIEKREVKQILIDEFGDKSEKIAKTVIKTIYSNDIISFKKISRIIRKVKNKIKKWGDEHMPKPIRPVYTRLLVMLDLLADIIDGSYKAHVAAVASIVSALVYLLFPFDLIPDFLPGVGFTDDAGIIFLVFYTLEKMIISYCKSTNIDINALNNGEYKKLEE
jgi:uncharacterized membrane protein YkvA (DUF1232 family)